MVDGSCHGVRRTKAGPEQARNGVETLMDRAWVTHHHCPLAITVSNGWHWDEREPKKNNKNMVVGAWNRASHTNRTIGQHVPPRREPMRNEMCPCEGFRIRIQQQQITRG